MKTKLKYPTLPKHLLLTLAFVIGSLCFPQMFEVLSPLAYAITLVVNGVLFLGLGLFRQKKLPTSIGLASFLVAFPIVFLGFVHAPYWVLSAAFFLPTKLN